MHQESEATAKFERFLATLDKDIQASFNSQQKSALAVALDKFTQPRTHKIDARPVFSIPFIKRRFYLVLLLGVDKRKLGMRERKIADQAYVLMGVLTITVFTVFGLGCLYVLKTLLGLDVLGGVSFGGNEWLNSADW